MKQAVPLSRNERAYINVMESLVAQEVGRQLQTVPAKIRRYLKIAEVVTYALNRLPVLYASSERGWHYQRQLAQKEMSVKIRATVRQAILAVQVDPLRSSQPIAIGQAPEVEAVLQALRALFQVPDLDWTTALQRLEKMQQNPRSIAPIPTAKPDEWGSNHRQGHMKWTHRHPRPDNHPAKPVSEADENSISKSIGWDNVMYRL